MELRDIEIYLTLAEELHFGRTAQRLNVSQARVSQAIAKQERRIGAPLFLRTSRRVELTEIGARLRDDLRAGYQRIVDGVAAATATARGVRGVLTLGVHGANAHEYGSIIDLFRRRYPEVELRFHEVHFSDPFGPIRSGHADLSTTWLPVHEPDLTVGPLLNSEQLVLMVAAGHPLAGRESIGMEDLADWEMPQTAASVPRYWTAVLAPVRTPGGRPIQHGPKVSTLEETMAVVASGDVICLMHGEAARYYQRPGIAYVRIHDAPIGTWALTWLTAKESALIRGFAQAAEDSRTG